MDRKYFSKNLDELAEKNNDVYKKKIELNAYRNIVYKPIFKRIERSRHE